VVSIRSISGAPAPDLPARLAPQLHDADIALSPHTGFATRAAMVPDRTQTITARRAARAPAPLVRVVLDDHARLPGRFFGRLTSALNAGLRG
jgi:hypothetical protein